MRTTPLSDISLAQNNMESITKKHVGVVENSIVRSGERLAGFGLSMPVCAPHTAFTEALTLVFTEALRSGAGTLTRDQFLDAESKLGAYISVSGDPKHVHITLKSLDTTLTPSLALFELILTKPTFAPSEIKRIKEHLTNALILSKENAKTRAYEGFVNTLVTSQDARYMFSIDALISELKKVTIADLKKFHKTLWFGEWIFTTGGNEVTTKKIAQHIKKLRGTSLGETIVHEVVPLKKLSKRSVLLLDIPHKQNIELSIGSTLPLTKNDTEYPAFAFGMAVLALYGGFSGRLMSTVREKEGLTYSIYGQAEKVTKTEQGFWRIATFFSPKDAVKGIAATLREVSLIREKGITENELIRFKAILRTRAALINDSLVKKVTEIQTLRENDISDSEYMAYKEKLQQMTVREVNSVLKKFLTTDTLIISGAGPIQSVKKDIEKFSKQAN